MKRPATPLCEAPKTKRGFTLVELLTVIAIIVLLIGVLVPAVNAVRNRAKESSTRATFSTLEVGIESFRADQRIGGGYPPSCSDWRTNNNRLTFKVVSPYTQLESAPPQDYEISGSGLLVWALAGADLNGCPGFKTFSNRYAYWGQDTSDDPSLSPPGAYALKNITREPYYERTAPLIDLSRVEVSQWNPKSLNGGSFEIPREIEARESSGQDASHFPRRDYPMFLDAFGGPILYWRADPSGIQACDDSPNNIGISPEERTSLGIYHFRDSGSLLIQPNNQQGGRQEQLVLNPRNANKTHRLRWVAPEAMPIGGGPAPDEQLDGFWAYIRNKAIQTRVAPFRPDSFLLISAGVDGTFGTADDIANFDHNASELTDPQ